MCESIVNYSSLFFGNTVDKSLSNRTIISLTKLLLTLEILDRLLLDSFESLWSIEFGWVTKEPLLRRSQCINVRYFCGPKGEGDWVKICQRKIKRDALEMEGTTVRLQFWMHPRPGEKGEQWSFRTCPSLRVALFAASFFSSFFFFVALNTGAEIVGANLWSTANPFNTSTDLFDEHSRRPSLNFAKVFDGSLPLNTAAPLLWKRLPYFSPTRQ